MVGGGGGGGGLEEVVPVSERPENLEIEWKVAE
jgi:hypothetical protein